jgi:hypothetical protein
MGWRQVQVLADTHVAIGAVCYAITPAWYKRLLHYCVTRYTSTCVRSWARQRSANLTQRCDIYDGRVERFVVSVPELKTPRAGDRSSVSVDT